MIENLKTLFTIGVIWSLLFLGIGFIAYIFDRTECYKTLEKLGYKGEHTFWTGCIIEDNGHKFLLEQLREINTKRGGYND